MNSFSTVLQGRRLIAACALGVSILAVAGCSDDSPGEVVTSATTPAATCVEATRNGAAAHLRLPAGFVRNDRQDSAPIRFAAFRYDREAGTPDAASVVVYPWTASRTAPAMEVLPRMGSWFSSDSNVFMAAGATGEFGTTTLADGTSAPTWTFTEEASASTVTQRSMSIWLVPSEQQRFGFAVAAPATAAGERAREELFRTVAAGPCTATPS